MTTRQRSGMCGRAQTRAARVGIHKGPGVVFSIAEFVESREDGSFEKQ